MNELDKIYEEIERLLEINQSKSWSSSSNSKFIDENTALEKANEEGLSYLGRGGESGGQYLATNDPNSQKVTHHYNTTYKKYVPYYKGDTIPEVKYPYKGEQPEIQEQPVAEAPVTPEKQSVSGQPAAAPAAEQPAAKKAVEQPDAQTVTPNEVHPASKDDAPEEVDAPAESDAPEEVDAPVEEPVEESVEEPVETVVKDTSEVSKGEPIESDAPKAENVEKEDTPQDEQAKQPEIGSGNTELNNNNRFKDVIDNPAIAKAIDAAQKPIQSIDFVTSQNGNQVVLMGESLESPIEVPYFISRFMESEAIGAPLEAGKATSLNAFMTSDVRAQLEKAGKSVTKIFLDSDGKAWFLDDKGSPVMLDKPEEHAAEKEKQDNTSNSQISNAITRDELVQVSEKIKGNFDKIKEGFFSAVGNNIYTISEIELGEVLNAEALKESVLREADSQDAAKTDAKSPEKKTPSKGSSEGVEFQVKLKIECNKIEEQEIPENKYSDYLNNTAEYMAKSFTELKISTKKKSKDESGLSLTGNMATVNEYTFKAGNPSNFKMEQAKDKKTSYIMNVTVICLKGSNNSSTFGNIMNKIGGVMASGSKAINKSNYVSV